MKKVSLKGVIVGSVTDIVATNLITIPLVIYVAISHNLTAIPKDQISSVLMQTLLNEPVLFSTQLFLGSLCSMLGGYVSARIAKYHELLNGALAAFLCVGSGLYALFFGSVSAPLWQHLISFIASPALSAFGGYLRLRSVRSKINTQSGV